MADGRGHIVPIEDEWGKRAAERKWDEYEKKCEEYRSGGTRQIPLEPQTIGRSVEYFRRFESPSALHRTKPFMVGEDIK